MPLMWINIMQNCSSKNRMKFLLIITDKMEKHYVALACGGILPPILHVVGKTLQ